MTSPNGAANAASTPPYIPWATFKSFLSGLKATAVPPQIDGTLMRGMSGGTQSMLRGTLRFLGLVEGEKASTSALSAMVHALDTDAWAGTLGKILVAAYAEILEGVDVERGTLGQLNDAFRDRGATKGESTVKAVRFWISAAREANLTISPHFGRATGGEGGERSKRSGRKRERRASGGGAMEDTMIDPGSEKTPPPGLQEFKLPIPGSREARLWLPEGMTEDQWKLVNAYITGFISMQAGARAAH